MASYGYQLWPVRIKLKLRPDGTIKKDVDGLPGKWTHGGLTDPEEIKSRWTAVRATGYMIVCGASGITGVDLDVHGPINGWANYVNAGGTDTANFVVKSWSGGWHLYHQSAGIGCSEGTPQCVDVKGVGGGLFGPRSIVLDINGNFAGQYTVHSGRPDRPGLTPEPPNLAQITKAQRALNVPGPMASNDDPFFTQPPPMTRSRAFTAMDKKVADLKKMKNIPNSGMRKQIMGTALFLGGLLHAGLNFDESDIRRELLEVCDKIFKPDGCPPGKWHNEEDEACIEAGIHDGQFKKPIVVYDDPPPPEQVDPLNTTGVSPAAPKSFESLLVDASALDDLPDPEPLIDRWLFRDATARLVGQPGSYKSFLAIDMACCVALGRPWHGCAVHQTPVLYIVGEGLSGYKRRISAWCKANDVDKSALQGRLKLTRGAVQIGSEMWGQLCDWVEKQGVKFIIGDTQSKMTIDSEENSNDDAKKDHAQLDALRLRTGATLFLLHHTGHPEGDAGRRGRGASTWRGAVDTELIMTKVGERKSNLLCDRHKESESGFEVGVELYPVAESLAVRVLQEPSKTDTQIWVESKVAAGVWFGSQSELVQAARAEGHTISNADKKTIFERYQAARTQTGVMTQMGVANLDQLPAPLVGGQPW